MSTEASTNQHKCDRGRILYGVGPVLRGLQDEKKKKIMLACACACGSSVTERYRFVHTKEISFGDTVTLGHTSGQK